MHLSLMANQLVSISDPLIYTSVIGLLGNAVLLLALGTLYDTLPVQPHTGAWKRQILLGFLVGLIGTVIMLNPWPLTAGIFFDTRSVLLSISGLFLGGLPTLVAVLITASLRIFQGGEGMVTGVTVIVVCAALGLGWRRLRTKWLTTYNLWELYGFGLVVHAVMLLIMLTLPDGKAAIVLQVLTVPIMLIYPVVTVLLGLILVRQEHRLMMTAALSESENRFRAVFEQAALGVSMSQTDTGQFVRVNPAFCAMVGYTQEEMKELTYMDLTYGPDLQEDLDNTRRMLAGEITEFKMEKRYRHRDGHLIWVRINIALIWDTLPKPAFTVAVIEDITQAKAIDQRLRYQAHLLQNVSDAIMATDLDFRINLWNPAAESIYGWSEEEAVGKTVKELLKPDYGKLSREEAVTQFFREGIWSGEVIHHNRQGEPIYISNQVTLLIDEAGVPTGTVGVNRDITEQVRIQRQMQQIIESVPEGVILLESDYRLALINPIAEGQLALLAGAQLGQPLTHLGSRPLIDLLVPRPADSPWHEITHLSRVYEMAARPLERGDHGGWVLVLRDVTEEREQTRYSQAQERLATVGQLAAGIAHDFNNIMGVIVLYAQMLQSGSNLTEKQVQRLGTIQEQAQTASKLIGQILDFSRRSVFAQNPVDILPLIKESFKILERTLPENLRMTLNYDSRDYPVYADPTRIQQVVMNLVFNARDAMPMGGMLRCTLRRLSLSQEAPLPLPDMRAGDWVHIVISDTGTGIEPEILPRIFEPFFTTKAPDRGTGLGLSQVYGIVKQHNGFIDAESEVGQGTTLHIYLPLLTAQATAGAINRTDIPEAAGETLLVVEDNRALREAVVDAMISLGYQVISAVNGTDAMNQLSQGNTPVDLVLTDLVMPDLGGMALYFRVQEQFPEVKVAIMTGYPMGEAEQEMYRQGRLGWIQKPFVMSELADHVRGLLDDRKVVAQ